MTCESTHQRHPLRFGCVNRRFGHWASARVERLAARKAVIYVCDII